MLPMFGVLIMTVVSIESNVIRSSVGVAMDVLTPIGPLNFSFAQPVTKKSSDKTETFRFNIGTTF